MLFSLILLPIALLALFAFYHLYYKRVKLPPGPLPLPFVGNLHTLQKAHSVEHCLAQWRSQFGDVYTLWMGEVPVVCVNDYATIIQTFQKDGDAYAGRYANEDWERLTKGGMFGIVSTEGDRWREQRRFALHTLRDFGFGRNLMQDKILEEVHSLVERVDAQLEVGNEVDMAEWFDICIGSVINAILFGYRYDDDCIAEFWEVKRMLQRMFADVYNPLLRIFQWKPNFFRHIPLFRREFEAAVAPERKFREHFQRQIDEHQKRGREPGVPPADFVEAYLEEKARRDAAGEQHNFTLHELKEVCRDFWVGGQETSSSTMAWAVAYLIRHPQVQAKAQAELDAVVGDAHKTVTMAHKQALPYTNALVSVGKWQSSKSSKMVFEEVMRVSNLLPINLVHRLMRDVQIGGRHLAKGTAIVPQISMVLSDEKIFDCPNEFRPERFLDAEGQLKRVDELIPFSVGKRQCPGESLARMELYLFTANLLNKYEFLPGQKAPSLERRLGATIVCPKFTCRLRKRQ